MHADDHGLHTLKRESLLGNLATRACWHALGATTTVAAMVAVASLAKGNSWLSIVPDWVWVLIAVAGWAGTLRYARWYRSE